MSWKVKKSKLPTFCKRPGWADKLGLRELPTIPCARSFSWKNEIARSIPLSPSLEDRHRSWTWLKTVNQSRDFADDVVRR